MATAVGCHDVMVFWELIYIYIIHHIIYIYISQSIRYGPVRIF